MMIAGSTKSTFAAISSLGAPPAGDASAHLEHRLTSRWDDLLTALHSGNFYIELLLILIALGLAGLIAAYISRRDQKPAGCFPSKIY